MEKVQALLKIEEVAEVLSKSPYTVYRNYARWGLPVIRMNNSLRVRPESLSKWLAEREQAGA